MWGNVDRAACWRRFFADSHDSDPSASCYLKNVGVGVACMEPKECGEGPSREFTELAVSRETVPPIEEGSETLGGLAAMYVLIKIKVK